MGNPWHNRIAYRMGLVILALQLVHLAYARLVNSPYLSWAPFGSQNPYRIDARIGHRQLSAGEILDRYHRRQRGLENRSIQIIQDLIRGRETLYPESQQATVTLTWSSNGGPLERWTWPLQE